MRSCRQPTFKPLAVGFITAVAVLAGFRASPLLQLSRVPTIRVLRRDVGPPPPLVWLAFGPAVIAVVFLVYWTVRDFNLFLWFTLGLAGFLLLLAGAGAVLVTLAGSSARHRRRVVALRRGQSEPASRRESLVQIVAFGTGIMVLLLLGLVRNDLANDWRISLPEDLPNYFFINIPQNERDAFMSEISSRGATPSRVMPMIRGRLTAINDVTVERRRFNNQDGEEFAGREQNLTWADELGPDNRVVSGQWWKPADKGKPLVPIATEFQESMGLQLGDKLTFDIAGETIEARIANFRKVKWDSFQHELLHRVRAWRHREHRRHLHDERAFPRWAGAFASLPREEVSKRLHLRYPGSAGSCALRVRQGRARRAERFLLHAVRWPHRPRWRPSRQSRDERRYECAMLRTARCGVAERSCRVCWPSSSRSASSQGFSRHSARPSVATSLPRACWR